MTTAARLPPAMPYSDHGEAHNQPYWLAERTAPTAGGGGIRRGEWGGELFLGVAAVARRLGVAPATLRTWDRRYGLGPAEHAPGAHRRYGPADVARLEAMQQALLRGATPSEAARHALGAAPQSDQPAPVAAPDTPGRASAAAAAAPEAVPGPVRVAGRSLRLAGSSARARGLARAAVSLDAAAVRLLIADSLAADGVIATWDLVIRPVLGAIAKCWEDTGAGVEIEHLLSDNALAVLRAELREPPAPAALRPVLLACVPDELHSLPIYPLAATLTARGLRCRVLGAALPADALTAAVRRTAPSAVFLWAQMSEFAAPDLLAGLPRLRPRVRVFAGGPGWAGAALPSHAERLTSLATATERIVASVGSASSRPAASRPR